MFASLLLPPTTTGVQSECHSLVRRNKRRCKAAGCELAHSIRTLRDYAQATSRTPREYTRGIHQGMLSSRGGTIIPGVESVRRNCPKQLCKACGGLLPVEEAMKRAFFWTASAIFTMCVGHAQSGAKNGEWPTYGGDTGNTRYSPLDQVNAGNFDRLQVAWKFKTDNLGPTIENNLEGTPLMVKGVLYATAGTRRAVVALDAATGELLWTHSENEGERGNVAPRKLSGRGLAYWTDGREERIIYVTPGYRLIALDAKTGSRIASFGTEGAVDWKPGDNKKIDPLKGEVGL